jgi:hypothetical protein
LAEIAKSGTPSLASVLPPQNNNIAGLRAGENIAAGDACRINAADGLVYRSSGAAATANANVHGFAAEACNSGEAVTLLFGVTFRYAAGLTPGASYFLSGTVAGGIADAASTGGTVPLGFAVDATRVRLMQTVIR